MAELSLKTKFIISICWDILDFTIFRIPGFGMIMDIIAIPVSVKLWGTVGAIYAWELIDPTDQIDAELPTMTLIGIISMIMNSSDKDK